VRSWTSTRALLLLMRGCCPVTAQAYAEPCHIGSRLYGRLGFLYLSELVEQKKSELSWRGPGFLLSELMQNYRRLEPA
jgi:hypothetical protein